MREEKSAFARGPHERPLRVVLDRETAPDDDALALILGVAEHELIELTSTQEDESARLIEVDEIDSDKNMAPVRIHRPEGITYTGVPYARQYVPWAREAKPAGIADEKEALRALLLCSAAYDLGADSLVTGSPVLLRQPPKSMTARSNPMTTTEAVALVGLFLRLRGHFTIARTPSVSMTATPWLFYWIVARDLLPAGWSWLTACHERDEELFDLAASAIERVGRALRARDRLHEQVRLEADNETRDAALFYFDIVLLMLTAAFDVSAAVAHLVHGLPEKTLHTVGWRRTWRQSLAERAPELVALMEPGKPGRDTLELVALLRNQIHGKALRAVTVKQAGEPLENLVEAPSGRTTELLEAVSRLGGVDQWGIRVKPSGGAFIEPDRYVEALIPSAVSALDSLMEATVVIPGRATNSRVDGPPHEPPWDERTRRRFRLFAGI